MPRSSRLACAAGLAAASMLLAAAFPGLPAASAATTNPGEFLDAVAAVSRTDAWAVGTLIEHWNGHKWGIQRGALTGSCHAFLFGVAATSASSAWAVGSCLAKSGRQSPIIERWNGTRWLAQATPRLPSRGSAGLASVGATSRSNAWAVGAYDLGSQFDINPG